MESLENDSRRVGIIFIFSVFILGCSSVKPVHPNRFGLLDAMDGHRRLVREHPPEEEAPKEGLEHLRPVAATWRWPLQRVEVTSNYGSRGHGFHEGLDLRAAVGTAVYAAHSGVVLYAGQKLSGYGRLIVLRHGSGIATIYAHNSRLLVKKGQRIQQGQKIALSGKSGHVSGPHLHFEVRKGVSPIDPLEVMPRPQIAAVSSIPNRKITKRD